MKMTLLNTIIIMAVSIVSGCGGSDTTGSSFPVHKNVTVTFFWVGEEGDADNGYIPNIQSAWDNNWKVHYGGIDDPDDRDAYFPANFTPHENPFYFALPYSDFNEGGERKASAFDIVPWAKEQQWGSLQSMCKNRWVKIVKGKKAVYAQWEDVGPFGVDDTQYVFGNASPQNEINNHAGLDVSPAVRDYLGLSDIDKVNWKFIDSDEVPDGPWKEIVTHSQIDWD